MQSVPPAPSARGIRRGCLVDDRDVGDRRAPRSNMSPRGYSRLPGGRKLRRPLLLDARNAFLHVGTEEVQHLECKRGVEDRAGDAEPIVESTLGPALRQLW